VTTDSLVASAEAKPVVGLGQDRYQVELSWASSATGAPLRGVSQVAVDSHDQVYVFQRSDPPVVVLDTHGQFVRSWGHGVVTDAHGIFISPDDRILLVDRDGHRVICLSTSGDVLFVIGDSSRPMHQAPFNHPADVAVATDGTIYVADGYGNSCVHHFSSDGGWLHSWGSPGHGPGQFTTPHGIWILRDGRVLVTDRENDRVQVFLPDGTFIEEWRDHYHPMDIYVDASSAIYITDQVPRLSRVDPAGRLTGRCKPVPVNAHGVWGDSKGNLFLAEVTPGDRITRLTPRPDMPSLSAGTA
jgi:DNA-binding beta-propeller fold protein YncE